MTAPPAPAGAARVETRASLGPWRDAWDRLVERQPLPSPFLRSWWLATVPALYVLVVDGDELVGGLALGRSRRFGITHYSAPGPAVLCPDHLDVLADPARTDTVVAAVRAWFAGQRAWLLDVRGLVEDPMLAQVVGGAARPDDVAPWAALPVPRERRSVRRSRRRLADRGLVHRAGADVEAAMADLRRLHAARGDRGPFLAELDAVSRAVSAGAERGEAVVAVLGDERQVAAVVVGFHVAGRLSLYQVARSMSPEHDGAGTVLLADVVAAADGVEVDLLRGDEAYKRDLADQARVLTRVRAARGPVPRAVLALGDRARRAKALAVRIAAVSGRRASRGGPAA